MRCVPVASMRSAALRYSMSTTTVPFAVFSLKRKRLRGGTHLNKVSSVGHLTPGLVAAYQLWMQATICRVVFHRHIWLWTARNLLGRDFFGALDTIIPLPCTWAAFPLLGQSGEFGLKHRARNEIA
jgi:hypothetical protein